VHFVYIGLCSRVCWGEASSCPVSLFFFMWFRGPALRPHHSRVFFSFSLPVRFSPRGPRWFPAPRPAVNCGQGPAAQHDPGRGEGPGFFSPPWFLSPPFLVPVFPSRCHRRLLPPGWTPRSRPGARGAKNRGTRVLLLLRFSPPPQVAPRPPGYPDGVRRHLGLAPILGSDNYPPPPIPTVPRCGTFWSDPSPLYGAPRKPDIPGGPRFLPPSPFGPSLTRAQVGNDNPPGPPNGSQPKSLHSGTPDGSAVQPPELPSLFPLGRPTDKPVGQWMRHDGRGCHWSYPRPPPPPRPGRQRATVIGPGRQTSKFQTAPPCPSWVVRWRRPRPHAHGSRHGGFGPAPVAENPQCRWPHSPFCLVFFFPFSVRDQTLWVAVPPPPTRPAAAYHQGGSGGTNALGSSPVFSAALSTIPGGKGGDLREPYGTLVPTEGRPRTGRRCVNGRFAIPPPCDLSLPGGRRARKRHCEPGVDRVRGPRGPTRTVVLRPLPHPMSVPAPAVFAALRCRPSAVLGGHGQGSGLPRSTKNAPGPG